MFHTQANRTNDAKLTTMNQLRVLMQLGYPANIKQPFARKVITQQDGW